MLQRNHATTAERSIGKLKHAALVQKLADSLRLNKSKRRSDFLIRFAQCHMAKVFTAFVRLELLAKEYQKLEEVSKINALKKRGLIERLVHVQQLKLRAIVQEITSHVVGVMMQIRKRNRALSQIPISLAQKLRACYRRLLFYSRKKSEIASVKLHLHKTSQLFVLSKSLNGKTRFCLNKLRIYTERSRRIILAAIHNLTNGQFSKLRQSLHLLHSTSQIHSHNHLRTSSKSSIIRSVFSRLRYSLTSKIHQTFISMSSSMNIERCVEESRRLIVLDRLIESNTAKMMLAVWKLTRMYVKVWKGEVAQKGVEGLRRLGERAVRERLRDGFEKMRRGVMESKFLERQKSDQKSRMTRLIFEKITRNWINRVRFTFHFLQKANKLTILSNSNIAYGNAKIHQLMQSRNRSSFNILVSKHTLKNDFSKSFAKIEVYLKRNMMLFAFSRLRIPLQNQKNLSSFLKALTKLFAKNSSLQRVSVFSKLSRHATIVSLKHKSLKHIPSMIARRLHHAFRSLSNCSQIRYQKSQIDILSTIKSKKASINRLITSFTLKSHHSISILINHAIISESSSISRQLRMIAAVNSLTVVIKNRLSVGMISIAIKKRSVIDASTDTFKYDTIDRCCYTEHADMCHKAEGTQDYTEILELLIIEPLEIVKDQLEVRYLRETAVKKLTKMDAGSLTDRQTTETSRYGVGLTEFIENEADLQYSYTERLLGENRPAEKFVGFEKRRLTTGPSTQSPSRIEEGSVTNKGVQQLDYTETKSESDYGISVYQRRKAGISNAMVFRCILEPLFQQSKTSSIEAAFGMIYIEAHRSRLLQTNISLISLASKVQHTFTEARAELSMIHTLAGASSNDRRQALKNKILTEKLARVDNLMTVNIESKIFEAFKQMTNK